MRGGWREATKLAAEGEVEGKDGELGRWNSRFEMRVGKEASGASGEKSVVERVSGNIP
jgi:hypothetical protein